MKGKGKTTGGLMEWIETTYLSDEETRRAVDELAAKITIRQDLIALRKRRGLTQRQLAERMGVSQPTVAVMESEAARNVELQTLLRAAVALGARVHVSLEELPAPVRRKAGKTKTVQKRAA